MDIFVIRILGASYSWNSFTYYSINKEIYNSQDGHVIIILRVENGGI
jgi:hypothetical protein